MNFRTEIHVSPAPFKIGYHNKLMMLGSCFTRNIGEKLRYFGFDMLENPYGITFNPVSIVRQLREIMENTPYQVSDLVFRNGQFHSLQHHSSVSGSDQDEMIERMNQGISEAHAYLKKSNVLFISLGSAFAWRHRERDEIINNCHKIPSGQFSLELSGIQQLTTEFSALLNELKLFNKQLEIVFTVSPVRHARNGLIENTRSKALLIALSHHLCDAFDFVHYFPSYEIMMDDLRDYRFYEDDLLHPSVKAIDYIWEKFTATYFESDTMDTMKRVKKVRSFSLHRPQNNEPEKIEEHQVRLGQLIKELFSETGIDLKV